MREHLRRPQSQADCAHDSLRCEHSGKSAWQASATALRGQRLGVARSFTAVCGCHDTADAASPAVAPTNQCPRCCWQLWSHAQ
eukprot:364569-Chlamydomonas_euryale.AAC.26